MQQSVSWLLGLKVPDLFHYRLIFIWTALFVSGLVLSYDFADNSVTGVLIFHITDNWKNEIFPKAAIVVNFEGGLSAIMTLAIAHVSDAYIGRFTTVAVTTFSYLIGIVVLSLETNGMWIFYGAAVIIALGRAGQQPPLRAFLADQISMQKHNWSIDSDRVEARTTVWWRFAIFLGSVISLISNSIIDSWAGVCHITAILMGAAYMIFWSGYSLYDRKNPTGSPLTLIYKVFKAAILKRHFQYPEIASRFYKNCNLEIPLSPNIPIFRGLDKAAIVDLSSPEEDQVKEGKLCTAIQVMKVKELLKMVPMWTTFLVYSLVQTTGSTFFFSQTNNLNDHIFNGFEVPIVAFLVVESFSRFIVSYVCVLLISKLQLSKVSEKMVTLMRICAGMACSLICCIIAFVVEVRRLHLVNRLHDPDKTIAMSIFWLTPQFILLGLMEGLAEDGLNDLLYNHVASSLERYGPPFNEVALGIGQFLSILCILVFGSWFGDHINKSRLDKYYLMLAILNIGNLCLTLYICSIYANEEARPRMDVESNDKLWDKDGQAIVKHSLIRRGSSKKENTTIMIGEVESNGETPDEDGQGIVKHPIIRRGSSKKGIELESERLNQMMRREDGNAEQVQDFKVA